jgi:ubiquitin C-terminal hydrolase
MKGHLTLQQIDELRAAANLARVTATKELQDAKKPLKIDQRKRKRENTSGEEEEDEDTAPDTNVRRLLASLTDGSASRTNTADAAPRPFTILLWNIENYGEHKGRANLFANKIIRHVLDRLNVDVAIFLETQSVPNDAESGIENRLASEMRTAKDKKKGPGTDLALKKVFSAAESAALEKEEELRQAALAVGGLDEEEVEETLDDFEAGYAKEVREFIEALQGGESTFHHVASGVTGRQKPLPPKVGPYRSWPRGSTRAEKQDDISRFKKIHSYVGSEKRPTPDWLLHSLNDLTDVYDLRFVRELPDSEDDTIAWPTYDDEELTRPATRDEIARLRRAVSKLCYTPRDLLWWTKKEAQLAAIDSEKIESELKRLSKYFDDDAKRQFREKLSPDSIDVAVHEEFVPEGKEGRDEVAGLLQRLERSAVLTLKKSAAKVTQNRANVPPRDVIGFTNDGNACYLLSILQLLNRVPVAKYDAGEKARSHGRIAELTGELLAAAAGQAKAGTYATTRKSHPAQQTEAERNYVRYHNTSNVRSELRTRCGWRSTADSEDAHEALITILQAFGPTGSLAHASIATANAQNKLDSIRPTPLHFFVRIAKKLDHTNAKELAGGNYTEAEKDGEALWLVTYDSMNALLLPVPEGEKTGAQAFVEAQASGAGTEPAKFSWQGKSYEAPVLEEQVRFLSLPDHLLVRIERMRTDVVKASSGVTLQKKKINTPVVMSDKIGSRELQAFVCHHGDTADDGHYTSYVRIGTQWFHVDDSVVTPVATKAVEKASAVGYIYYYAVPATATASSGGSVVTATPASDDEDEPAEDDEDEDGGSEVDEADDGEIEEECQLLAEILEHDPGEGTLGFGTLPEPKDVDQNRLRAVQDVLSNMIGVRNVETYLALFRSRGESLGKVSDPILNFGHPNVGHYVFKAGLLSTDENGRELGFQDPAVWINGRCPFFFELDVAKDGSTVRLPFLALHAPYGMPAAFRKSDPEPRKKATGTPPPLPSKATPIDFDGDDTDPLKMRADALRSLLEIGIPAYAKGESAKAMAKFGDAIIAGDFNLDMKSTDKIIQDAYGAVASAGFVASNAGVPTTVRPVEYCLPAGASETADAEEKWFSHAYDNIFVRSTSLPVATTAVKTTAGDVGTRVCGVVDVFDAMIDYVKTHPKDSIAEDAVGVIGNGVYYHKTRHAPAVRAAHELQRWNRNADPRARAYFVYRRYISDHLPVFVDLDLHSNVQLAPSTFAPPPSGEKSDHPVIGIANHGNTCYLNATLQLLCTAGVDAWAAASNHDDPKLYQETANFIAVVDAEIKGRSYAGDGRLFASAGDARVCRTNQATHAVRSRLRRAGIRATTFELGDQEDACEALDAILDGSALRRSGDGKGGGATLDHAPATLRTASANGTLATVLPAPSWFFLVKTLQYDFDEMNVITRVDGLRLDDRKRAFEIECHSILRLGLPKSAATLQQVFDAYAAQEVPADGREEARVLFQGAGYNGVRTAESFAFADPLPHVLFVQLKRFETTYDTKAGKVVTTKITTAINVSGGLQVRDGAAYDVVAFMQHAGISPKSGHYIAYVNRNSHWWNLNDDTVTMDPPDLASAAGSGYVYLLRRRTS